MELLENLGFQNVELKKDIYGNDRMIRSGKLETFLISQPPQLGLI